jgi:hypothetical protein
MSVLETPRIYFRGQVAWDPIVTNNTDRFYDEVTSEPVFRAVQDKVEQFRKDAIAALGFPAGQLLWNPHGTHRSTFFDTAICGASAGDIDVENDPFIGSPVVFRGMLVDLEPYGGLTSQLFFDAMTFGIDGGYQIAGSPATRFTSRYVNFGRTTGGWRAGIGSTIWQTTFPKSGLTINAFDSPALQALIDAMDDGDVLGLTVEWNAYHTVYFDDPKTTNATVEPLAQALQKKLEGGGFQPNPARSLLVGVVGLWRRGEAVGEPSGRALLTSSATTYVASAQARVAPRSITLDLSNSISEVAFSETPSALKKQNLGTLTVAAADAQSGKAVPLASFDYAQYDTSAYLRTAGIVTLPITPEQAAIAQSSDLQLLDAAGNVLLAERARRAIPLTPNLYLDQPGSGMVAFQLYDRGMPAGGGIGVTVYALSADSGTILGSVALQTDAGGIVAFPVLATSSGIVCYAAAPAPDSGPPDLSQGLNPQLYTYQYVRVLQADTEIATLPPTFDNVFAHVLANWKAMAPCMDNWLDLANREQVLSFAQLIRDVTNPAAFESYYFMPVTRDMTPGQRTLLYQFLDGPKPPEAASAESAEEPKVFVSLSRMSRSG